MLIELESWEYEWVNSVGIRRFTANWNKNDASHYKRERMEDDRTAQVAAAACELAVAKLSNKYWSGTVWPADQHDEQKHRADVGTNFEVRRVRTRDAVAIRKHQLNKGMYIWACKVIMPEIRKVEVLGYLEYDAAWNLAAPSDFDPDSTRYLPLGKLTPAPTQFLVS
jgi:hypothetical protein